MKIVTDSAADMPAEELHQLGIELAPLFIQFPDGEVSSEDISHDEFYNRLRAMAPEIPTTAMPSAGVFAKIYEKLTAQNEDALSVHISTGLSGTIGAARNGAELTPGAQVTHFDTLTLSGAERFMVLAAALANKAGWAKETIVERLTKIREQNEMAFTLETLTYLAKGGRIGRVQALAGAILGLKPVIGVDHQDGKYNTLGKGRTVTKALEMIADHFSQKFGQTPVRVVVMHGQWQEKAGQLSEILHQRLNVVKLEQLRVSPVLGVHTGPGVVGAAVVPAALFEGL